MRTHLARLAFVPIAIALGLPGCEGCNPTTAGVYLSEIVSPSEGASISTGDETFFRARAYFMGDVPSFDYTWTSSLQGQLGSGLNLVVDNLVAGSHQISFSAQGTDPVAATMIGEPVIDTITITVSE